MNRRPDPVDDALFITAARVTQEATWNAAPSIAGHLMLSDSIVNQWGNPAAGKPGPVARVARFLDAVAAGQPSPERRDAPLLWLASRAGLVAYRPAPDCSRAVTSIASEVTRLAGAFGRLLGEVDEALATGRHICAAELAEIRTAQHGLLQAAHRLERHLAEAVEQGGNVR